MDSVTLYKTHFEKEDDTPYKKVYVNYPPDGTIVACDCCDEQKEYLSITMLCGDVACICKECLESMAKELGE